MGLRCIQCILQSAPVLTADSLVLTLTLAFLDFGLDFAQSFPFHAQFCHFGLVFCLFDDIHFLHNTNAKQTYIWQFLSVFSHLSSFLENKRFLNPHNRKYIAPTLTPKLFSNMKKGFSGEHTPLFPSMLAIQAEEGEGSGHPSEPQPPPSTAQPTHEEPIPNIESSSHQKTQTPRQTLKEVIELCRIFLLNGS
ncbi:hypothetical protein Tco_0025953 [Tanacetum coccineum]